MIENTETPKEANTKKTELLGINAERLVSTCATLETKYGKVSVAVNKTDMNIIDLFKQVIEPLLLAAGYSQETISSYFDC